MRQLTVWRFLFVTLLACSGGVTQILAQDAPAQPQNVWSGVFSEAQAYRGEKVADTTCIGCHGAGLDGGDSGPKLVSGNFLSDWNNRSTAELFDWILKTMPENAPGTLKEEEVAAVIAYMFQRNNMPAGKQDLPMARDALGQITILATKP